MMASVRFEAFKKAPGWPLATSLVSRHGDPHRSHRSVRFESGFATREWRQQPYLPYLTADRSSIWAWPQ